MIEITDNTGDQIIVSKVVDRGFFHVEFCGSEGYSIMEFDAESGAEFLAAVEQAQLAVEQGVNDLTEIADMIEQGYILD